MPEARAITSSHPVHRYTEPEIQRTSEELVARRKQSWSENPRLYMILRDIGQIKDDNQPQLLDDLIRKGVNDFWIPITSDSILYRILKPEVRAKFLQVQDRVCIHSKSFRVGSQSSHGNFATGTDVPFQRRRSIGSGHFGYVDEVSSLTDGAVYARKSIRRVSYFEDAAGDIRRFRCEIQVLRRIKHRHCVQIMGSYTTPHDITIIMSPVANSNLGEYLNLAEKSSDPSYARRIRGWFGCLITAVQYLHSNHIRHRDIKPANILVHGDNILLVDFELALDWKDLLQSTTMTNRGMTPLYAAPEVIHHKKCNSTSDMWSLGCVFLEMVTVLKGKSIAQLREHFTDQTESALFFNNHPGIQTWTSLLENMSSIDNAPLQWISKMVRPDRSLRSRATSILDDIVHFYLEANRPNPFFGKCCQRQDLAIRSQIQKCTFCALDLPNNSHGAHVVCLEHAKSRNVRIYRNPEVSLGVLPVQTLISFLHPSWMTQHLTYHSLKEFAKSVVHNDRWESFGVEAELLCLPGKPLYVTAKRYFPMYHLTYVETHNHSHLAATRYSLPIGMHKLSQEATTKKFNDYLDDIVSCHLLDFAVFIQLLRGYDHSSKVLGALFIWFEQWKVKLSDHELCLMQNAIKLIAIQSILGVALILQNILPEFTSSFPSPTGPPLPFPSKQTPRLLNRQVKVVFFAIYKSLLVNVLAGFKSLALKRRSSSSCVFIAICLSFLIERIEASSRQYQIFSQTSLYQDKPLGLGDTGSYSEEVESVVFARIFRVLIKAVKGRSASDSAMDMEFQNGLRDVKEELDSWKWSEEWAKSRVDVNVPHSSRFVAAILDLVLRA